MVLGCDATGSAAGGAAAPGRGKHGGRLVDARKLPHLGDAGQGVNLGDATPAPGRRGPGRELKTPAPGGSAGGAAARTSMSGSPH